MASVSYCFNICRSVDKSITQERRSSVCNPTLPNIPTNTGALLFGRRLSLSHITFPNVNSTFQSENNLSSDQDRQSN